MLYRDLLAVRGLFGKAHRVATSIDLFTKIESGEGITPELTTGGDDYLVKLLIEASRDNELFIRARRNIQFEVQRPSFAVLPLNRLRVDRGLLDQAVYCLFDNAAKYSFASSIVHVRGELWGPDCMRIVVANTGLRISPDQVDQCRIYGWRSSEARNVVGEGNGIGLWIVDNVMRAHGGRLVINPTSIDGVTEVALESPLVGKVG